jgi:methyl-accepting chemotaxis protein
MKNMSIKSKLMLSILIPLISIIFLSAVISIIDFKKLNELERIEKVALLATKISALVHETQKERGMSAGYLGSKGKKFHDKLPKQRKLSDKRAKELKYTISSIDLSDYSQEFNDSLSSAINMFDNVAPIRGRVTSLNIPTKEAIGYYTKMNGAFLNTISVIAKLSNDASTAKELSAYSNYLLSKERAGIERAVGSNTFARDSFGQGMRTKLNNLIAEQNSYMDSFLKLATPDAKGFYTKSVVGSDIDEVNRMRKVMLDAKEIGGFGIDGAYWFDTITKKINLLKNTEDYIASTVNTKDKKLKNALSLAKDISALVHETQKERGNTAGFIGSKGKGKFVQKLANQRASTDIKLKALKAHLAKFNANSYSKKFQSNLSSAIDDLNKILDIRAKVSSMSIPLKGALGYYTKMNAKFLDTIGAIIPMAKDASTVRVLNTYYNFLMSKERAGIERAVLSNTFARNKFVPGMKEKFIKLVTEQNSFIKSFEANANAKVLAYYNQKMSSKYIDEVNRMRSVAMGASGIGGFNEDATYWFKTITSKINKLKKVEDYLSNALIENINKLKSALVNELIVYGIINVIIVLISLLLSRAIARNISNSLDIFQHGLEHFFKYLNKETNEATKMTSDSKDEFGKMINMINYNIESIENNLAQDSKLISNVTEVAQKVSKGHFSEKITESAHNDSLSELKSIINGMLDELDKNTKVILDTLNSYIANDYRGRINKDADDRMKELFKDVNLLGETLEKNSSEALSNGMILQKDSNILEKNVATLTSSMHQQASSLEETSSSIEEILATLKENSLQANSMSEYAINVQESSSKGTKLAHSTADAMDKINESTAQINESIESIDQIAFQTNILSLNAAVEAATAGEAGKGFAVVAGEVRNLANRSADTAKDIKDLVEKANQKTTLGKNIAQNMVEGYNELNEHISNTLAIIKSVADSIKEQHSNIEHISTAVHDLDKTTQQIVGISTQTKEIATDTLTVADELVDNAKNKEFNDKESILNSADSSIKRDTSHLKREEKTNTPIAHHDGEWDSF